MFKIDFAPGTIFLPRKKEREFYIRTRNGMTKIPYGWVRSYSYTPPNITFTKDIKFRVTVNRDLVIHTSHSEFMFEPDVITTVTNVTTVERVWPVPAPQRTRGFKWL